MVVPPVQAVPAEANLATEATEAAEAEAATEVAEVAATGWVAGWVS